MAQSSAIRPDAEDLGIVTIGKNTHPPNGIRVGGARIGSDLDKTHFPGQPSPRTPTFIAYV